MRDSQLTKQPHSLAWRTFLALLAVLVALQLSGGGTARGQRAASPPPACEQSTSQPCLGPPEVRRFYGVDPVLAGGFTGRGRTIAIIVSFGSATLRADLHAFDRAFSLPDPTLDVVTPIGRPTGNHPGWDAETTLDVEWAHVMAPGARLLVLVSPVDETEGLQGLPQFLQLERYAVAHGADVISQSWAATEDTLLDSKGRAMVARFHQLYSDATRRGVTVLGASGDDGAAGPDLSVQHLFPYRVVQWPASDPLVLAVGGSRILFGTTDRHEVAWPGSGGGFSKLFPEPQYQRGLPASRQTLLHGRRGLPDVALDAARESPLLLYVHGKWALVGGTSASTPQWAGLIALADSMAKRDLGAVQSTLYRLAASSRYPADLFDITEGNIKDPPGVSGPPLSAGPGWDPATGLGTPRAATLLEDLARATKGAR